MSSARQYETLTHATDVYTLDEVRYFKDRGLWKDRLIVSYLEVHAASRPQDIAVVDRTKRVTWHELNERVNRIAAAYISSGLGPGDTVAIQLPNTVAFLECYLGAQKAGLRALTLLTIYRERDLLHMLATCKARALVIPDHLGGFDHVGLVESIRTKLEHLEIVIVAGEAGVGMVPLEKFGEITNPGNAALRATWPDPDTPSKISFTSGTTGLPKGVVHTHNTDSVPPRMLAHALGLGPTTPIWMASPIAHATGLLFGVYMSVMCGAKLVLQDRWDPEVAVRLISAEKAVVTVGATPFIDGILGTDSLHQYDLSHFRYFISGGARIPSSLVERVRDELKCNLLRVFGSTEAPLHTLNHPSDPWEKKVSRDGRPFSDCPVRIVNPDNHEEELVRGQVGEYSTWGPHVFLGYINDPERTWEAKDALGHYYSSDLCMQDDEGFILYVDRIKDIVNRGGIKISALEVENVLVNHPDISQIAVVAIPDPKLGERACAFVVPRANVIGPDLQGLSEFLQAQGVTKQKWPERIEIVDHLPTTPTGKIQKHLLRQLVADVVSDEVASDGS